MTRVRLANLIPQPRTVAAAAPPVLDLPPLEQTPSGILLPPGVSAKLSARAAIAEAEALVASLPVRQPVEADLLAEVQRLAGQVEALSAALARTEGRLVGVEQVPTAGAARLAYAPAVNLLAREPLFLDLETTGLKKSDAIVEAAVINLQGRVLLSTLINPQRPIPPDVSAINGVYDADVADAPTWDQVLPLVRKTLAGHVVVAHNAKFEAKFLPADWQVEWTCSKELADRALGKRDGLGGLAARLTQLDLEPGPTHTAAGDCLSTLRLVRCLAGETSPVELIY